MQNEPDNPQNPPFAPQGYPQPGYPQQGYPGGADFRQPYQPTQFQYQPPKPFSGKAIASMVLGGVGLFLVPLGIITALVGGLLGFLAMKETREPDGARTGRGLAIGGLITCVIVWLINAAVVGVFVFVFMMVERQQQTVPVEASESHAIVDLKLIHERVQLYYAQNGTLAPGGPVVYDGGTSGGRTLYPRVEEHLTVRDLVRPSQLMGSLFDYELIVHDDHACEIRAVKAGLVVRLENVGLDEFSVETMRDFQ